MVTFAWDQYTLVQELVAKEAKERFGKRDLAAESYWSARGRFKQVVIYIGPCCISLWPRAFGSNPIDYFFQRKVKRGLSKKSPINLPSVLKTLESSSKCGILMPRGWLWSFLLRLVLTGVIFIGEGT